jgi:predicted dehydrogenase
MTRRLKILFAGLGSIGQRHVQNLRTLLGDDVEILAYRMKRQSPLLNPDMTARPEINVETAYGIRSFGNLADALQEHPDAVFVTNPNALHLSVALAAAREGCHLFIEKPISHTLTGIDELIEIVERKKLVALIGYQFRFHPGLRLIKSSIEKGQLGLLAAAHIVNGEYLPAWHPYENYRDTHPARRDLGGGCLSIQTHELDYALWFFGMPRNVYAVGGHLSSLEIDVEDTVSILMECDFRGRSLPVHIHLDYLQQPPQRICEIYGDAGKIKYDYYTNLIEIHETATGKAAVHRFENFQRNQMFIDELKHFLACVRGAEQPLVDLREARRSMAVAQAASKSLESRTAIGIGDV